MSADYCKPSNPLSLPPRSFSVMTTLTISPSRTSISGLSSRSNGDVNSGSPRSAGSQLSLDSQDEENITITAKPSFRKAGKQKSQEDLRLLAVSTHMTELSYAISDIQTRIFEIQELRHKSQSSGDATGTTAIIDQSLMSLDEKLESVSQGMKTVNESLEPLLQNSSTPTFHQNGEANENALILRKHAALAAEWEAVQDESEVLREELKEDKWLTVFRTVTDQADGMMSSLEKGVNRCQEFIWQVRGTENPLSRSQISLDNANKPAPTFEVFTSLLESFEAKKKHYMPATSKVLSIIDKGVRDRVTKNGETLRRHAESAQRWKNLKERIARTDQEMENIRKILLGDSQSETGSSTAGSNHNGHLATPPSGGRNSRAPSSASTISRSMSPFRKLARKITGSTKSPVSPVTPLNVTKNNGTRTPSSEPTGKKAKTSLFTALRVATPTTPERPSHKHSQSLTPVKGDSTVKGRSSSNKPGWNSSTKLSPDERGGTMKATPPRRAPSATGNYSDIPPVPSMGSLFRRSLSRTSMASSRPWSPLTSSASTNNSSSHPPVPSFRPPSRARTPSRAQTPSRPHTPSRSFTPGPMPTPRPRPKTPSHIPGPTHRTPPEGSPDDEKRPFSPALSTSGLSSSTSFAHPPRPPSRSMIPIPSVHLSSPSRPGTSMSSYGRSSSPSAFKSLAARAQTPESTLRAKVQQMPIYQGTLRSPSGRPSLQKQPPSSFRDGSVSRSSSRPNSRTGAYTPTDNLPLHEYIPGNPKDPLDTEVALIANSIAHGLLVERVDPPLKTIPKSGEEIKAQYAFSNALSRKVVTCKLTTLTRGGKAGSADLITKKVMCRVGGGWQDLSHYILNRQAGM